jgi:hypothetical protein
VCQSLPPSSSPFYSCTLYLHILYDRKRHRRGGERQLEGGAHTCTYVLCWFKFILDRERARERRREGGREWEIERGTERERESE